MKAFRFTLAIACLGPLAIAQNLVLNPGFETGAFAPWVERAWGIGGVASSHSGTHYADTGCVGATCIRPSPAAGAYLYQDIATVPGTSYTLTFFYFPGPAGGGSAELQALWGPTATPLTTGGAGVCTGNCVFDNTSIGSSVYVQYTVPNLVATSTSMRLEFLGRQDPASDGLDDIVLTAVSAAPVPTPALSSWGMLALGLGLAGVGYWTLRRQRSV